MSQHQSNVEPTVKINDPDGGSSYTYDGTGGSIVNFCLNCHDADSSTAFDSNEFSGDGNQPFTDGRTPQDIKSGWTSGAHSSTLTAEACLACHGGPDSTRSGLDFDQNMHGTDLPFMLSSTVAGETVTVGEEDLCFACHDPDGPALTDIETQFTTTETYTATSGALVNSQHDVTDADQTYSGAVIECRDCHLSPHVASTVSKILADPDPDDGETPAAGTSWAGSSFLSEWCMDCHDGSYPSTLTPPTNALTDIFTCFTDTRGDQHGASSASKNVNLRSGSGFAQHDILDCTDCHNAGHGDGTSGTAYPNLFNLKSIIYSKDGTTELSPDTQWLPGTNVVRILDLSAGNIDANTNGKAWCSTCHPNPMGGNKSSGCMNGSCHNHDANSF